MGAGDALSLKIFILFPSYLSGFTRPTLVACCPTHRLEAIGDIHGSKDGVAGAGSGHGASRGPAAEGERPGGRRPRGATRGGRLSGRLHARQEGGHCAAADSGGTEVVSVR